jgi:hypothetical protein
MKRSLLILACLCLWTGARADDYGFLDLRHHAFRSLLADPRELQLSLRTISPVGHKLFGEVAAGDYYGLYTRPLGNSGAFFQWSMGGGIFSRFDLVSDTKDLQVTDYNASMPLDIRAGRWSTRLLPFHVSSHLGDDYIKRTGTVSQKYSFDAIKLLQAFEPTPQWRLYGGYIYTLRWGHTDLGRHAFQAGLEWTSRSWARGSAETYWATDFQSWQRTAWNPQLHTQVGIRFRHDPTSAHTFSFYLEYAAGRREQGQFYEQRESHWTLGLKLAVW